MVDRMADNMSDNMSEKISKNIEALGHQAIEHLARKHAARERALPKSRTAVRFCANSIRAAHRQEFGIAEDLAAQAGVLLAEMAEDLREHQDIYFAGFVQDAQKEYAEAACFRALIQHRALPSAESLSIGYAAYLNGLAESVGELRRYVLDQLRRGNLAESEEFLGYMDDIYALLISVDFPDAITAGLRRTTDATRGILEKTRGDLTSALSQVRLQQAMLNLQRELQHYSSGNDSF